jgi:hypothetical protein
MEANIPHDFRDEPRWLGALTARRQILHIYLFHDLAPRAFS